MPPSLVSDPAWDLYQQMAMIAPMQHPAAWVNVSVVLKDLSDYVKAVRTNPATAFESAFERTVHA